MVTCEACGAGISTDVGVTILFDGQQEHIFHGSCAPKVWGYTIEALRQIKEEIMVRRAQLEMGFLDYLSPTEMFTAMDED